METSLQYGRNSGTTITCSWSSFFNIFAIEKALAGRKNTFRGPFVVQGCYRMTAKDWSEWRWAFAFYGVENWLLLRTMCGTKRLNPFFRLYEASEVLNKFVMRVWSNSFTSSCFVSFIVTVFVSDIEGIQNKVICLWIGITSSVNVTSTCSDNLYDISRRKSSRRGLQFEIAWGPENGNSPLLMVVTWMPIEFMF